jgi:Ca-activated chloride channel family protein
MKRRVAVGLACLGAVCSSAGAFAIPIEGASAHENIVLPPNPITFDDSASAHVVVGTTLLMDARLGHVSLPLDAARTAGETYLFASVTGIDSAPKAPPPLDVALVIDRSGSMKGRRIANAIAAAKTTVDRMKDGDSVLVVSFDTEARVALAPTILDAATRPVIRAAIDGIRLGGDTCISCGLEEAKRALDGAPSGADRVRRMMLLSDGATNNGIRDVAGLRILASIIRENSCPVTTIGVDLDYDEKVMSAIASEANGNHYFVADAVSLPAVFDQEFDKLQASIANDALVIVDPAPGVEIDEVFDRSFRREGRRVVVPFGAYRTREEKSLLLKLRVPVDHDGRRPVVDLKLEYRDLRERHGASFAGALAITVKDDGTAQKELDPFVQARVERSQTARALTEASDLIKDGRADEARRRLAGRSQEVGTAQQAAQHRPVSPSAQAPTRARGFDKDFEDQVAALEKAKEATKAAAAAKKPDAKPSKAAAKILRELDRSDPFR